jgi:putative aldouronate transport system permease protein
MVNVVYGCNNREGFLVDVLVSTTEPVVKRKKNTGRNSNLLKRIYRHRYLYMLLLPGLAVLLIFSYAPMYGIQLAFKEFMFNKGVWGSPWVGFKQFQILVSNPQFMGVFFNTIWISVNNLIWGFPAPIILALLINEIRVKSFKRVTQSILYLPHFITWIALSGIIYYLLSRTDGVLNKVLEAMGIKPLYILGNPSAFRPLLYISGIWKTVGWGMIIYLAALAGVNPSLYESAVIDGANRFKQCIYITIPCLKYAIIITLILRVGGLMNSNFDQIFNLISPSTRSTGDVIATYVYRMGIQNGRYDFATAVDLFTQVINCALLFAANWVVKLFGEEGFI